MDFSLSGNALKTFARSVTCLARIGTELVLQASPSQFAFHTINSSRSAYQSITLKSDFFDAYSVSASQVQCSVLLKAVCSILRTPVTNIDHLSVQLPSSDAAKVEWTLHCINGMKKVYWISCNVEPDVQHLSLDRTKFPSNFVVRPNDFNRLLANFQSSLQEITVIATEPSSLPSDAAAVVGGKAVEIRSYIDPTKENSDISLHTQLWIDPSEEFIHYKHNGDPVDVTFSVKELKAFISFCEGCEVEIHFFFEKAGEPVLMAPKFGLDDGCNSDFDATMVLATMLTSQLNEGNNSEPEPAGAVPSGEHDQEAHQHAMHNAGNAGQRVPAASSHPLQASDHTRIWSEISGSVARSSGGVDDRQAPRDGSSNTRERNDAQMLQRMVISENPPARENVSKLTQPEREEAVNLEPQDPEGGDLQDKRWSQHHPSNWMNAADDEDDDEDGELCVQTTPQY